MTYSLPTIPQPYSIRRNIVNYGVLRLTQDQRKVTGFTLWGRVERTDSNASFNYKLSYPESFYGYAQGIRRGHVLWTKMLKYNDELIFRYENPFQEQLLYQLCFRSEILSEILDIKANFGIEYDEGILSVVPELALFELDGVAFRLFGKTTLVVDAFGQPPPNPCSFSVDWKEPEGPEKEEGEKPWKPKPPPPVIINGNDPRGYDLPDPPYVEEDQDDGLTYFPQVSAKRYLILSKGIWCPNDVANPNQGSCNIFAPGGTEQVFTREITSVGIPYVSGASHGGCPQCSASVLFYYPDSPTVPVQLQDLTGSPWAYPGSVSISEV